jgi:predicted MFS family arabinose efflux permease
MDLKCTAPALIGLLFTFERISEGLIGCSIVGLTDKLGRKKSTLLFLGINLVAQTIIIFCTSFTFRLVGYVLYGCG